MKRVIIFITVLICISPEIINAATAKVITRKNAIRENCKFFSPLKSLVQFGNEIELVSKEGDWYRVNFKGISGCIHKTAIKEKKFSLSGLLGGKSRDTSNEEVALAGKGFSPEVESSYRKKHPQFDFDSVNRLEKIEIKKAELYKFIKEGELNLP
jgi:hypothetical protein